jgi:hypothetical protein
MSGGNVNANITANVAQFNAAMAQATAAMNQFAAQAQAQANAAASGIQAATATMTNNMRQAGSAVNGFSNNINNLGVSAGYVARKLSAMLDESIAGRWRQFDGTLSSVVATMAAANLAMTATVGVAAAAAGAVGYLAYQWIHLGMSARSAAGEMVMAGNAEAGAVDNMRSSIKAFGNEFNLWQSDSEKSVKALAALSGPASQYKDQLLQLAGAQHQLIGGDVSKYAEALYEAFNKGAEGAVGYADKLHALDAPTKQHIEDLIAEGQQTQATALVIQALQSRYGNLGVAMAKGNAQVKERATLEAQLLGIYHSMDAVNKAADNVDERGTGALQQKLQLWKQLRDVQEKNIPIANEGPPIDQQANDDRTAVLSLNKALDERAIATGKIAAAQRELAAAQNTNDPSRIAAATEAVVVAEKELAATHTVSEEQQHEATLTNLQGQLQLAKDNAQQRVDLEKKIADVQKDYYGASSNEARVASNQVMAAQREATDETIRLLLLKKDGEIAAAHDSMGAVVAIEGQKLAILRQYGKENTAEYQEILNQQIAAQRQAGDQATHAAEDQLRARQALAGKDYDTKLAIEDQILAMLKAHYGAQSVQYEQELVRQNEMLAEQQEQKQRIEAQDISSKEKVYDTDYNALKKSLDKEVAEYQITKAQERATLDQFQQEHDQVLVNMLTTELTTLTKGTTAFEAAYNQREQIMAKMKEQHDAIAAEEAEADQKASQRYQEEWTKAFDSVGSEMNRTVGELITGSTTWQKAYQQVAKSIVTETITMAEQVLGRWVATELAKTASTETQNAVRAAQDQSGATGLTTLLLRALGIQQATDTARTASHGASEATMTGQTVAGDASRTASNAAAESTENTWFIVRAAKWIASELGLTASTTSQSAIRTATQSAADTEAATAAAAANVAQAESYAAVGAAAAGASAAATPIVGWTEAPAAAAATYADLSAFAGLASLDTGTYNVPKDMVANIHQGEMVVPKPFADSIRNQGNTGTTGSQHSEVNAHFAPTFHGSQGPGATLLNKSFEDFKRYMNNVTRNGNLMLPGRG